MLSPVWAFIFLFCALFIIIVVVVVAVQVMRGGNSETNCAPLPRERKSRGHAMQACVGGGVDEQHKTAASRRPDYIIIDRRQLGPSTSVLRKCSWRATPDVRVAAFSGDVIIIIIGVEHEFFVFFLSRHRGGLNLLHFVP